MGYSRRGGVMAAPPWVTALAAISVVVVWCAAMVVGALTGDWTALTVTTPVMLLFGGFAFGVQIIRRQEPRNGNGAH